MKNKILALLASVGLVASASAVEINENLSINGFIDAAYTHNNDNAPGENQQLGLDEIELNFLFNHGPVSGAIHIDDYDADDEIVNNDGNANASYSDNAQIDIEQAHITYALDNGVSFTIGKYGSALGFEREDPAGLYTYSRAYTSGGELGSGDSAFNLGDVDTNVVEGLTIAYANDVFTLAASLENPGDTDMDGDNLNTEISFSYTGFENVVIGGGYFFDNQSNRTQETDALNLHASVNMGKLLVAGEYIELSNDTVGDRDAYLLLADYDFNDKLGAALRYSSAEMATAGNPDFDKITIAPNYSLTDNIGVILEYSDIDQGVIDENLLAVEVTYTF